MQSTHGYFTRVAHAEAARLPAGSTMLSEQLAALDELHSWVVGKVHTFRRRFKHARATLLTSLDASSLKAFLEDVQYQGPLHVEVRARAWRITVLLAITVALTRRSGNEAVLLFQL